MATLIEQLINKMGLRDEPNVLEKTTELMRLLELRSTNVPLQINEYGKIVLCGDLASTILGIAFDKEQALKLSGLRKTHYMNNKRMFEKLLDLNQLASVKDICLQLGLNDVARKAEELLQLYNNIGITENADIDITHPQYAAMAVFYACRLLKRKVSKTKLMPFSNLRPSQWHQLEQRWERSISKHHKDPIFTTDVERNFKQNQEENIANGSKNIKPQKPETEDYEKWKSRMLAMAQAKLRELDCTESSEAIVTK
ncbi:origin recognition complex subunit 6 [Scaptodrosophila lebanonensis]|uniref:Origin recognition complex subunit 6 n=1 Tax=Drosophila lebanonensis TaxID=7225 RepID=A0A6J2U3Z4_DROLE|nr:origin recognition complex subunit 6 [Scaptodrosophila lebanonensis]